MRYHFIAIAGSAMHNLALALHHLGHDVSGSDDEIVEPAKTRLAKVGILPEKTGWFPEKINADIDAVILGMHARADNPELAEAIRKKIKVFSYPEFLYEHSKNKTRVVIGGSHGKTTITSMILHVLKTSGINFDFMVGAQLEGFDTMVKLSNDAKVIILEGDEYLSSPIDRRPKFHLYHAHIGLISGIAWDHINVFPTLEIYEEQFRIFAREIPDDGKLFYCLNDATVKTVCEAEDVKALKSGYTIPKHSIKNGKTVIYDDRNNEVPLQIFGEHNLMNLEGARMVCNSIGISNDEFYTAIKSFKGAARRLELLSESNQFAVFRDFAHSPSKLKATLEAVRKQFPERKLIACMELHTFSSLNENFLEEYNGTMDEAEVAVVYFNPKTIEHKKLPPITSEKIFSSFGRSDIKIMNDSIQLMNYLNSEDKQQVVYLMMSSGTFDGLDLKSFAERLSTYPQGV